MGKHQLEVVTEPGSPRVTMRRTFDAPRALVFDAFTKIELITKWKSPPDFEVVHSRLELRVGSTWEITYRMPNGVELGLHGDVLEVEKPTKFVRTFAMAGKPGKIVESYTFEEHDGKTTVITDLLYESVEARDTMFTQGQGRGMPGAYDILDELLVKLAA